MGNQIPFPTVSMEAPRPGDRGFTGPLIPGGGPDSERMQPIRNNLWETVDVPRAELWVPLDDKSSVVYVAAGPNQGNAIPYGMGLGVGFIAKKYDRGMSLYFHRPGKYWIYWDHDSACPGDYTRYYIRLDASAHEFHHPGLSQCQAYYDPNDPGDYQLVQGADGAACATDLFKDGYSAVRTQRLWVALNDTTMYGPTAWAATAPLFLIDHAATSTARTILRRVVLEQIGQLGGGDITVEGWIDNVARYGSGGAAMDPVIPESSSLAVAPGFTGYYNPGGAGALVAAGATAAHRFYRRTLAASLLTNLDIDLADIPQLHPSVGGSILFYAWAATTAPGFNIRVEVLEV